MIEHPIKQLLRKPGIAGKMIAWPVEHSEFNLEYRSRELIKAQVLADFIMELSPPITNEEYKQTRKLYVDRASNIKGSGAGITLED